MGGGAGAALPGRWDRPLRRRSRLLFFCCRRDPGAAFPARRAAASFPAGRLPARPATARPRAGAALPAGPGPRTGVSGRGGTHTAPAKSCRRPAGLAGPGPPGTCCAPPPPPRPSRPVPGGGGLSPPGGGQVTRPAGYTRECHRGGRRASGLPLGRGGRSEPAGPGTRVLAPPRANSRAAPAPAGEARCRSRAERSQQCPGQGSCSAARKEPELVLGVTCAALNAGTERTGGGEGSSEVVNRSG